MGTQDLPNTKAATIEDSLWKGTWGSMLLIESDAQLLFEEFSLWKMLWIV